MSAGELTGGPPGPALLRRFQLTGEMERAGRQAVRVPAAGVSERARPVLRTCGAGAWPLGGFVKHTQSRADVIRKPRHPSSPSVDSFNKWPILVTQPIRLPHPLDDLE